MEIFIMQNGRLLVHFNVALSLTLFMTASCDQSILTSRRLLLNDVSRRRYSGSIGPPRTRGRREFSGESRMGRKLANLWPCRRAKSLCGSTEIARARFFSTLNGPRTTIGCCDELFGRAHWHELSFSLSLSLSRSPFLAYNSATQSQMWIANRLPLFANRPDTRRFRGVSIRNEFRSLHWPELHENLYLDCGVSRLH